MKIQSFFLLFVILLFSASCKQSLKQQNSNANDMEMGVISKEKTLAVIDSLILKYGEGNRFRIERGVNQAAKFWKNEDGDIDSFAAFCQTNFIVENNELDKFYKTIERSFEILSGNMTKMSLELKEPLELDRGEISPADMLFAGYNPASHLEDDFFRNKIAFHILLNFPFYSLEEKMSNGDAWSRKDWAYSRAGDLFTTRIPAEIIQDYSQTSTGIDAYIAEYNIYMGNLVNDDNNTLFPKDMKLLSHWGLRDELKSHYSQPGGLEKQKMIFAVMNRIIKQEIPEPVVNSNEYLWNPLTNKLFKDGKETTAAHEPDTRYQHLLNIFKASEKIDQYCPYYNTAVKRAFDEQMQMTQPEVEKLFVELLSSTQVKEVAQVIKSKLGRDLEPFDIWYKGFEAEKQTYPESDLDAIVSKKYPTTESFEKELPVILTKLGFEKEKANYISSKITVDAARGSGHAAGAEMRTDKAHLRTRIAEGGMNYKGYNIAIHEFGHNVEQTITLYDMDHYFLRGVPNTAFTEALAFVFQTRDMSLLGLTKASASAKNNMALEIFWSSYEIMGVSLVDMNVWKWLYEHPDATAAELKEAVLTIAKDIWNKYYADVFGKSDEVILAVYSHMIAYPLYLSAYPVGHLISYQIEEQIAGKDLAKEIQRIFVAGNVTPAAWMKNAVGKEISNQPLLNAVDIALKEIK